MIASTVPLPEPFLSALKQNDSKSVCDAECPTPQSRFGRALARMLVGRDDDARSDLHEIEDVLGDACRLELAFLDQRHHMDVERAAAEAGEIRRRVPAGSPLAARAAHVVGLCELKLSRYSAALDDLLESLEIYRAANDLVGRAAVLDSLGMAAADAGFTEDAVHYYALSLVDKMLLVDWYGIALTLGNLGRLHLDLGRIPDAIACFERDLAIAETSHDDWGQARMHEDLGRAYCQLPDFTKASEHLQTALSAAREHHYRPIQFFANKDLALLALRQNQLREAETQLNTAAGIAAELKSPYFDCLVLELRGELLFAQSKPGAEQALRQAIAGFQAEEAADYEISATRTLARVLAAAGDVGPAASALLRALGLAHRKGLRRHVQALEQSLAELGPANLSLSGESRQVAAGPNAAATDYVALESVGKGSWGEVLRVYDPNRGQEVALKRLVALEHLYDVRLREKVIASARAELALATRVRHPGVAQVYAIGNEATGGTYIVQEFIPGRSLRIVMRQSEPLPLQQQIECLARVAFSLGALHAAGVCHRDVKPDNIIVRPDGSPVLVDFGIARPIVLARHQPDFSGTYEYCSPEQLAGKECDGRSDLYSLGVVAFEWLCGVRPFSFAGARSPAERTRFLELQAVTSLLGYRRDLPAGVDELVRGLLAKKPRQRPRDGETVGREFQRLAAEVTP